MPTSGPRSRDTKTSLTYRKPLKGPKEWQGRLLTSGYQRPSKDIRIAVDKDSSDKRPVHGDWKKHALSGQRFNPSKYAKELQHRKDVEARTLRLRNLGVLPKTLTSAKTKTK